MIKTNLPVILLRGIVLLPNTEIRLEFENDESKNIIDVSEMFHDNEVLVVSSKDPIEEGTDINNFSKIGVIAKISHKIELPNGNLRVMLTGLARATIHEYLNWNRQGEVLESIVSKINNYEIDSQKEIAIIRKLYREVEDYIKLVPYISNSVLSLIVNSTSLSKMTDIIAIHIIDDKERLNDYLCNTNPLERSEMILEDIYKEKEIFNIEKSIDNKVRHNIDTTQKELLLREKIKVIKEELGDNDTKDSEIEHLNKQIEELDAPEKIKERIKSEVNRYSELLPMSQEVNVVRNYIEWLLQLPWNYKTIDNDDLEEVKRKLDTSHYGLTKVKNRIIEYLAVKKMTNSLNGPIICLVGPPGVGKTSLAFSIAESLNRNFVKISVGGINDASEIMGHRKTYLGASPGRIIQAIKKAKSSNPVFLIDEIDKMTYNYKEDPASALLEVLDPEQNKLFSDNYLEEEYDLSQVMFIATANYIEDIPEALKDRLEIVDLSGYTEFEKLDIAKKYLIPDEIKKHGLQNYKLNISDDVILKIIRNYTKEAGVRELERMFATIFRKIVTEIVMNKSKKEVFTINENDLNVYLGKEKYHFFSQINASKIGVVNGLAYTYFGGDILPIEVNYFKGNGTLVLTGSLGDVMKESAKIALSYIKSNYKYFNIDYNKLTENDIHIHVPEGAIPKDGPSAGITLTTALISAFTNLKIPKTLAMTGEITLRGSILPIGGLKEKSIGAHRNGIKKILIPYDNLRDLDEIPKEIKKEIEYIPVRNYKDVYKIIRKNK